MAKTAMELVQDAKQIINEITAEQANQMLANGCVLLDVREPDEFNSGHIENAHHIPRGMLEFKIAHQPHFADKNQAIIVYCKTGGRSALATLTLTQLGYNKVYSLIGGYDNYSQ